MRPVPLDEAAKPVDSPTNCAPSFEEAATMLWTMGHDHWSFMIELIERRFGPTTDFGDRR